MAWMLYRQIDCIRNSKQQFAQTYVPHKSLVGKDTDKQIELCLETTCQDWNAVGDNKKYGRMFYKVAVNKTTPDGVEYTRYEWTAKSEQLTNDNTRAEFIVYLDNCSKKD